MSALYARISSDAAKEKTQRGHREIEVSINGWHTGVKVIARAQDGAVTFDIFRTGGSSNPMTESKFATM